MQVLNRGLIMTCLMFVLTVPAFASTGIVRVAVTGTDASLLASPQKEGKTIARLTGSEVFFAEEWPVANAEDGSRWYVVLFAVGRHAEKPLSLAGGSLEKRIRPDFSRAYVDASRVRVLPLEPDDWKALAATPYGKGASMVGKTALEQRRLLSPRAARDNGYSFVQKAGACIGANLPQIIRVWGKGEVKREYSLANVEHFDQELFRTAVELPGLSLNMLEDCQKGLIVMNTIELTRTGACLCGLCIGETTQQQVQAVLGDPRSRHKAEEGEGTEWLYEPKGEHFHSLRVQFTPAGILSGMNVSQWSAN